MKHRKVPPYPVVPAVREQGASYWLQAVGVSVVAVAFVAFFMARALYGVDRIEAEYRQVLDLHELHTER